MLGFVEYMTIRYLDPWGFRLSETPTWQLLVGARASGSGIRFGIFCHGSCLGSSRKLIMQHSRNQTTSSIFTTNLRMHRASFEAHAAKSKKAHSTPGTLNYGLQAPPRLLMLLLLACTCTATSSRRNNTEKHIHT